MVKYECSCQQLPSQANSPNRLQLTNRLNPVWVNSAATFIIQEHGTTASKLWEGSCHPSQRAAICHWSQCLLYGEPGISPAQLCVPGLLRAHPHREQGTSTDTLGISLSPDTSLISCLKKCPVWHLRSLDWGPEDLSLSLCLLSEACHLRPSGNGQGCFLNWAGLESTKSTTQIGGMATPGPRLFSAELL